MKIKISKGNKKLPKSTYILNMGSATACPSRKLGLCQAGAACYAMRAEKMYPAVLPYREEQRKIFTELSGEDIAAQLLTASNRSRANKMKQFRFSEAGDFETQEDVGKMAIICGILSKHGAKCYGYTARTDLCLTELLKVASVNVSNDGGEWINMGANRFLMVENASGNNFVCVGDCRKCNLCTTRKGKTIEIVKH